MDKATLLLLNQTVTIAPATGVDGYAQPTFGTGVLVNAVVFGKQKVVKNAQGQDVLSTAQTFVNGTTAVTTSSKITLPDGTTPPILAVATFPDADGTTHHKVIYT